MIKLNVMEILEKMNKTRYWLVKELQTDYNSVNKICNNEVVSLHLGTIEKLCDALNCTPNDLFSIEK
jgi:putative transcriptional regulator